MTAEAATAARRDPDLRTFGGRDLRVSVQLETLFEAERGIRTGRMVRAQVCDAVTGALLTPHERAALLASDYERIDLATLGRARRLLGQGGGAAIVEVSFVTASSQRARPAIAQAAAGLRELCGGTLVWLLTDLPAPAPAARLGEAITFLRAHGRSVFAEVNGAAAARSLRGGPIGGLAVAAPPIALDSTSAALWLLNAARSLEPGAAATRIACGLVDPAAFAGLAAAAGFSHIAGPPPTPQALAARGGFC